MARVIDRLNAEQLGQLKELEALAADIKKTFDNDEEVASADADELAEKFFTFAKELRRSCSGF